MGSYQNSWEICMKVPGQLGVMGLYRGAHLYFLSNLVGAFCQFQIYEVVSSALSGNKSK